MNAATALNNRRAFSLAFGLYLLWVFATWFLEGRILTFQRPEDITTLGIATTLALYAALRPINESLMAIATVLGLVEAIAFILARPAFEMLYLSSQYVAATTEAQRAMFLAAGEAMVAALNGTLVLPGREHQL
jgi:hypothetical protein